MSLENKIGKPPYTFIGMYASTRPTPHPSQVGDINSCSHCGRPLKYIYMVQNAEGEVHGLGKTCVESTSDFNMSVKNAVKASHLRYKNQVIKDKINLLVAELEEALTKYPGLSMRKSPYSSGSVASYMRFAISSMNPKALAKSSNILKSLEGELSTNEKFGYCVVVENTYEIFNLLREEGFDIHKEAGKWYFYKAVLESDAQRLEAGLSQKYPKSLVFYTKSIDNVSKTHGELVEDLKELGVYSDCIEDHEMVGKIVELTRFMSSLIADSVGLSRIFGNLKILKVYRETAKTIICDAEFYSGVLSRCGYCGLTLTNPISMIAGIGPICAEKNGYPRLSQENIPEILKTLEARNKEAGVLKKIAIYKSQILNTKNETGGDHEKN